MLHLGIETRRSHFTGFRLDGERNCPYQSVSIATRRYSHRHFRQKTARLRKIPPGLSSSD